jgi:malto-oligosyltrehalose trehalohydrolase
LIIYELHLGTFTERGTYLSAIDRLDELVELGATAIELMPLNETAGDWNWGYDGVQLFAPRRSYGTPHEFRQLVNAAHRKGLAVIVDVVYNHFGPEGNYLGEIGAYLSAKHTTIWGAAPNLDEAHSVNLRRWMIANAIYWLDEFHCDGLRVDAIHCIRDDSQSHWVGELSKAIRQWGTLHGRHPLLIAEANVYDPEMTLSPEQGGYDFDAAWSDCFLHSVFGIVRPGEHLSHRRYESDDLARVLKQGFVFEGTLYRHRERADREHRVATQTLVYSLQNHDAIGNHPLGQRFHQLTSKETQRSAAALYLLAPSIPMLFMGEEFCSEHPFGFFVDFSDEALRRAVVAGRHAEYPQHDWTHSASPVERQAFVDSRIGPRSAGDDFTWRWYQALIALRKSIRQIGLLEERWLRTWSDVQRGFYTMCYIRDAIVVHVIARITRQEHNASVIPLEDSALKDPTVSKVLLDSNESSFGLRDFAPNHAKVIANRHGLELIGIG